MLDQIGLRIERVELSGAPTPHWVAGQTLVVPLDGQAEPLLTVAWTASPRTGLHWREAGGPDAFPEVWTQGQQSDHRHWLPSVDHPGDRFRYRGEVRAPAGWRAHTNSGDDLVNYLIMVAAGPYEEHTHPDDSSVKVWVPPGTAPEAIAPVLDPVPAMAAHFGARTGQAYPWGDYLQVFVQRFLYFGMENTGATINSAAALGDDRVDATRPRNEALVAHELAHQWFGDLLTCRSWQELWLNEGFATFFAADWRREAEGEAAYAEEVIRWIQSAGPVEPLAGRFHQGRGHSTYGRVYPHGAHVLHQLRVMLGEDAFWSGIRAHVRENAHRDVETRDLQRAFEDATGQNLDWFFQQATELAHRPKLRVEQRYAEGRLELKVHQEAGSGDLRYTLPVDVDVLAADGATTRLRGWLDGPTLTLGLALPAPPAAVAVDPEGGLLVDIDHAQDPAALAAVAERGRPVARLRAIAALGETDAPAALEALLSDRSAPPAVRRAAAKALGAQGRAPPLAAAARDADPSVREAAVGGLGACHGPEAARALGDALGDPNPDVGAAALSGLARVDPAAARSAARRLARPGDREEDGRAAAAMAVLGRHGEPADLDRLLRAWPRSLGPEALRQAARLARRQPRPEDRARLGARVARATEPLLLDLDLRAREAAVDVLAEIGDEQSLPHLERARRAEAGTGLPERAAAAIHQIRARAEPAPDPGENARAAEVEAMLSRLDALEAELKALQERP